VIILAIETSCDETAIAVLKIEGDKQSPRFEILSNVVSSQVKIHAEWGGVVPNLAKREHIKNLPHVYEQALKEAEIKEKEIDIVAVVNGPGLEPALWTGINFAVAQSKALDKPLVAINHMEGHVFSVFLGEKQFTIPNLQFPILTLLVSGGHTEIVLIKDWMNYEIIGQTRDDAVGEAFDKVAKMLGLPYPGGPAVSQMADKHKSQETSNKSQTKTKLQKSNSKTFENSDIGNSLEIENLKLKINLPRPMMHTDDFDFSFSGLKTAVLYLVRELEKKGKPLSEKTVSNICAEFQQAAIDVLVSKTIKAAKKYNIKNIILGGGVSANKELKRQLGEAISEKIPDTKYFIPDTKFSGDNAAMIAIPAYFRTIKKEFENSDELKADGNLSL
jgi:N6-L-threonylcarbamoyladenine synthase